MMDTRHSAEKYYHSKTRDNMDFPTDQGSSWLTLKNLPLVSEISLAVALDKRRDQTLAKSTWKLTVKMVAYMF